MPQSPADGHKSSAAGAAQQCADAVLMIRPAAFGYNAETAGTNTFQHQHASDPAATAQLARAEFEQLAHALKSEGVQVIALDDTAAPPSSRAKTLRLGCASGPRSMPSVPSARREY